MELYLVIFGFSGYSILIFLVSTVLSFFRSGGYLLKLNSKYLGILIFLSIIVSFFGGFSSIESDSDLLYMFSGVPLGIVLCVFVNKTGFDITTIRRKFRNRELDKGRYSLRKDYFGSLKTGMIYLVLSGILWSLGYGQTQILAISFIIIGAIHSLFFDFRWAYCPYCDYKVRNIKYRSASIRCRTCRSTVIIHGNEAMRPRGRAN